MSPPTDSERAANDPERAVSDPERVVDDDGSGDARRFDGYERDRGSVGIRNAVLVLPSVICSHIVADRIAAGVDGAVSAPHDHGCAQLGADADQTEHTFLGVGSNPNVAGTLVVGLGCEGIQSGRVVEGLSERDVPVREAVIQDAGGSDGCYDLGVEAATELVERGRTNRTAADLGDLTVGVVASDVRDGTVEHADPLVGGLVDRVLKHGGRVVVAGIERALPHQSDLAERATADAADGLDALADRHANRPARDRRVYRTASRRTAENVTRLWGHNPLVDVVAYGRQATHDNGVALVDAPSRFEEAATALAAAGAQLVIHVTDDGIPAGHPVVPTIKVTGNADTYAALSTDIDVDARAATTADLLERVRAVAGGDRTCAERHGLTEFAITRVGPSM